VKSINAAPRGPGDRPKTAVAINEVKVYRAQ